MIHKDSPNGYFQTLDENGRKIEGETRMCGHCGFNWIYVAGSGRKRGYCYRCDSLLCGKQQCFKSCDPLDRQAEQWLKDAIQVQKQGEIITATK